MPTGTNVQTGQDWGAVNVGRGGGGRTTVPKSARAVTAAKASGKLVTEKRYGAGGNTSAHTGATIMSAKKLEEADDVGKIVKVDLSLRKAIMQARTAKKMTQKELATAINEKPQVIAEYESGKAVPNPQIIGKIERKLGCKLPRPGKKSSAPSKGGAGGKTGSTTTRGGPPKRR
mmetsp:Transcript_1402/g.1920  ORF Transcript_1402/g.1920 Transcript_1402/m.1920 type:complete len:174 (-) Transcript_1402:160-681(-)